MYHRLEGLKVPDAPAQDGSYTIGAAPSIITPVREDAEKFVGWFNEQIESQGPSHKVAEVNERRKKFKQGLESFKERLREIAEAVDEGHYISVRGRVRLK